MEAAAAITNTAAADSALGVRTRVVRSRIARAGRLVIGYLVAAPESRNSPITAAYVPTHSTHTAWRMTNDA